ncbi:MAG: sensor domain-containing diguanylate cyclase [Alphaproteobacteria bacterium]|nr:sensor domain-containing diguanylate cyclase [Alphaproteobacteria bacterium]MBV8410694.1 sensor domain-containing diguanylate cyclase [Alphaproteobacteria bacterium]
MQAPAPQAGWYVRAMEHLVDVVQELSLARDLPRIMEIVRHAARELTGADGATFVLRDNGKCYYAEENAIAPLWKGHRFPLEACISGWAMLNRRPAVVPDIYKDPRIPIEAYRPTFVRSLAMVPIRTVDPIGAIGNYWAEIREPSAEQVKVLQALADVTAVSMENVEVFSNLERLVKERTAALEAEIMRRRQAEDLARRQSLTDELTGLHNRRGFLLLASNQFELGRRTGMPGWIVFADADRLKALNDTSGHDAGDRLLKGIAQALRLTFREVDVIGRLGGDEFAIYATGEALDPDAIRRRLAAAIAEVNGKEGLNISLSIGVIRCNPEKSQSFEALLQAADNAMYAEKYAKRSAGPPVERNGATS